MFKKTKKQSHQYKTFLEEHKELFDAIDSMAMSELRTALIEEKESAK